MNIENIKQELMKAKQSKAEGSNYREQSFLNFIENVLNMNIVEVENLGDKKSYKDEFVIKASHNNNDTLYTFIGKYYDFHFFMPRENKLVLTEVSNGKQLYECEEVFYMSQQNNHNTKNHFLLNTPIDELIQGVSRDKELEFVVNALKDNLKNKPGYEYLEQNKDDVSTFRIKLKSDNKEVIIGQGFQNTIQVNMETSGMHYRMDSIQIHFRNKDMNENEVLNKVKSLSELVDNYFNDSMIIDNNNISTLINSLGRAVDRVNTDVLYEGLKSLKKKDLEDNEDKWVPVLYAFQIENENVDDEDDEYNQFEVHLGYSYNKKEFKLKLNYLFNEYSVTCKDVQNVIDTIESLKNMIKIDRLIF